MTTRPFRPIYYLGCKASLTPAIQAAVDHVDPSGGRLMDLFSGTGAVGTAMGKTREITTVDIQEYSRVLCSATLNPSKFSATTINDITSELVEGDSTKQKLWCLQPLIEYEENCLREAGAGNLTLLVELLEAPPLAAFESYPLRDHCIAFNEATKSVASRLKACNLWNSKDITTTKYFGGLYFSYEHAAMLDAALTIAENANKELKDTLLATTLSTASSLVNTVGKQFAQPIRPKTKSGVTKPGLYSATKRDRSLDMPKVYKTWLSKYAELRGAKGRPLTLRQDYLSALEQNAESITAVYADPPYTRDHYSRFYHVLETMCLRDNPNISKVTKNGASELSRGVYRENRHQSPFCIRSIAPEAFRSLFGAAREHNLPIVLSYSPHETGDGTHPRVVSMEQIVELANSYYRKVEVCLIEGVTHNKLNSKELKLVPRDHAEIILKCFC